MTRAGIQISSVRKYLQTPEDVLASFCNAGAIGYRIIQIQWISPDVPAEFIRDALIETGMQSAGTQDYYDEVVPRLEDVIAMNDLWGSANICVSGIPERYRSQEGCLAFAAELDLLSERLERQGMILSFHPRSVDVIRFGEQHSLELLRERTRPEMQFCLDVYHLVKAGLDPAAWIHSVRGRCDLIHFKDSKIGPEGKEVLTPVGQGSIAWRPIFQACEETGVQFGFAEQESWQKDPFECLKESFNYLVANGIYS